MFHSPILTKIADHHGKEVGHVILRWLLQRGISTIPKSMKPARMASNLDVFDFELTTDEMAQIATMNTGETLFGAQMIPMLPMFKNVELDRNTLGEQVCGFDYFDSGRIVCLHAIT